MSSFILADFVESLEKDCDLKLTANQLDLIEKLNPKLVFDFQTLFCELGLNPVQKLFYFKKYLPLPEDWRERIGYYCLKNTLKGSLALSGSLSKEDAQIIKSQFFLNNTDIYRILFVSYIESPKDTVQEIEQNSQLIDGILNNNKSIFDFLGVKKHAKEAQREEAQN